MKRMATISMTKAQAILQTAAQLGIPLPPLYAALDITPDTPHTIETHIPYVRYLKVWEVAVLISNRQDFPLNVARMPIEEYELVGFLALTSATIGEAFARVSRFQRIWMSTGHWADAVRRDGRVILCWIPPAMETGMPLAERCAAECAMARLLLGIRTLARTAVMPEKVTFAHQAPQSIRAHHELFGRQCQFSAPTYTMVFDEQTFLLPIPTANVPLSEYLERQCKAMLERFQSEPDLTKLVIEALARRLPDDVPTMAATARSLGMTERTLQRRLSEEGTSFHAIRDEARSHLARRHLATGRLSVAEVAHLTGFASVSAFYRAYRRWTGSLPSQAPSP
jgi:AraC-like DNA-binding protein